MVHTLFKKLIILLISVSISFNAYARTKTPAKDIPVTDAGEYFTGTNVETILAELGSVGPGACDITSVGDCASGASLDGSSDGGTWIRLYDGDSHYVQISPQDVVSNITLTLPSVTSTLIYSGGAFHDGFSDFVANEHIDWTLSSVGTIHATNYVDNDTTYTAGDYITLTGTDFDVDVKDEDDMVSDSAIFLATQQSIKAYVDNQIHDAVTVTDTTTIDMTLVGQDVKADLKADSVDSEHYIDDSIDDVHLNLGTGANQVGANDIEFQAIGSPTYSNAQHWFDIVQSSGIIDGYTITSGDDATHIDIAAGKGIVKTTDSELGTTVSFETSAVDELELTALSMNYIYVDYSAGSPQVLATTDYSIIELNRMFPIGLVYSNVAVTHIANVGVHISNLARTEHERLAERDGFTYISGATTTKSTLDLIITAGVWYYGHTRITTDALDTTGADTFIYIHYGTASWITDNATASVVDATHYNDGDDVLGELGVNAYGTQWLYVTTDSHYYIKYGTQNGTLSAAELAKPPAEGHIYLDGLGKLIAKIIVRQTGDIVAITQIFEDTYISGTVANHQELGELQGGTAAEYYHLTSSEHTELSAWLDDVTLGSSGSLTLPSGQTFAINAADISEEELEILDGATLTTTQINYLNSVTGTTGTGNLVLDTDPAFAGFPTTPASAPDADYEVANKKYVDDTAGATAWDDIGDPDAAATIDFLSHTQTIDIGEDDIDGGDGLILSGTGLGSGTADVTTLKIITDVDGDPNYIPLEIADTGGNLFVVDYTGGVTSQGKIAGVTYGSDGSVTDAELLHINTLSSNAQDQIDLKAPLISPTFATSLTGSYLTASELLITDGDKKIVSAPVATYPSLTELSYVKGLTDSITTLLNAKDAITTAGRSLTRTVNNFLADDELYTEEDKVWFETPAVEEMAGLFPGWMNDVTITFVKCVTDAGTVTINLEDGGDNNMLSAELVCDVGGQTSCASGCDVNTINTDYDNITAKTEDIDVDISAVDTATTLSIMIGYTKDD